MQDRTIYMSKGVKCLAFVIAAFVLFTTAYSVKNSSGGDMFQQALNYAVAVILILAIGAFALIVMMDRRKEQKKRSEELIETFEREEREERKQEWAEADKKRRAARKELVSAGSVSERRSTAKEPESDGPAKPDSPAKTGPVAAAATAMATLAAETGDGARDTAVEPESLQVTTAGNHVLSAGGMSGQERPESSEIAPISGAQHKQQREPGRQQQRRRRTLNVRSVESFGTAHSEKRTIKLKRTTPESAAPERADPTPVPSSGTELTGRGGTGLPKEEEKREEEHRIAIKRASNSARRSTSWYGAAFRTTVNDDTEDHET